MSERIDHAAEARVWIESRFYRTVSESRRERGMSSRVIECPFCGCYTEARLWSLAGSGKRCDCGATFDWQGTATLTRVAEQAEEVGPSLRWARVQVQARQQRDPGGGQSGDPWATEDGPSW